MLILVGSKGKEQGRAKNTKFALAFTVLARYIIYSKPPTGVMDSLLLVVDYPKLLLIDFFIFKNLLLFYFPLMTRGFFLSFISRVGDRQLCAGGHFFALIGAPGGFGGCLSAPALRSGAREARGFKARRGVKACKGGITAEFQSLCPFIASGVLLCSPLACKSLL